MSDLKAEALKNESVPKLGENPESKDSLRNAVGATCHRLQSGYFSNPDSASHREARASLAKMRRNGSGDIDADPLGLAVALFEMSDDFEAKLAGKGDKPSPSERAAYTALSLFAIHMQSAKSPAHVPGVSFASACGRLFSLKLSESIKPRIDAMLLAGNEKSRVIHIRSLISLLRNNDLGFDYGLLARDLRGLASAKTKAGVQLRWGRDFALGIYAPKKEEDSKVGAEGSATNDAGAGSAASEN